MSALDFLSTPARQAAVLSADAHRPWPLPTGPWTMAQTWEDLLFAHWPVSREALEEHVPKPLQVDAYEGETWLAITPFRISGLRLRGTFPLPRISSFPELNVRTYVTLHGKPGIWFFSLDTSSALAVEFARRTYRLPYFRARISVTRSGNRILYECSRNDPAARPVVFSARYEPVGEVFEPAPGTLEYFLTERYCLYTEAAGRLYRAHIHHPPWALRSAEADIELNTMPPEGIELPEREPLLHFAGRQDVLIWPLEPVP